MRIPFLDLSRQTSTLLDQLQPAVREVFASGRFILGAHVDSFERAFAVHCGAKHCVAVASGSDALELALRAVGIRRDDEVVVPAFTALATVAAVAASGATPILADVERSTLTLDPERLPEVVTERTRAIVAVHLYGQCADVTAINHFARPRRILVVEDAAQAVGAAYGGTPPGTLGDVAAFSFYPTKNLGACGDAGAVVTDDENLAERVRILRVMGCGRDGRSRERATHSRLDDLQAAVLLVKLPHVNDWVKRRRAIARSYLDALGASTGVTPPFEADGRAHAFHLFVARSPCRDELRAHLERAGIETLVHYSRAAHQHPAYADLPRGPVVESERAAGEVSSLPLYPELSDLEVEHIVSALRSFRPQNRAR